MNLKIFAALAASALVAAAPALAQDVPSRPKDDKPSAPPDNPPPAEGSPAPSPEAPPAPPAETPASPSTAPAPAPTDNKAPGSPDTGQSGTAGGALTPVPPEADRGTETRGPEGSPWVLSTSLGYASGTIRHPDIVSRGFSGMGIELAVGTEVHPNWRLSLAFSSFETKYERTTGDKFTQKSYSVHSGSGLSTLAEVPGGPVTGAGQGGYLWRTPLHLGTLGPRADYLPFGQQGPYVGLTMGLSMIPEIQPKFGASMAARIGGTWHPIKGLGLGAEAGAYGYLFDGARAALPYAAVRMTLVLDPASIKNVAKH